MQVRPPTHTPQIHHQTFLCLAPAHLLLCCTALSLSSTYSTCYHHSCYTSLPPCLPQLCNFTSAPVFSILHPPNPHSSSSARPAHSIASHRIAIASRCQETLRPAAYPSLPLTRCLCFYSYLTSPRLTSPYTELST
ncbi:hypothetical protein K431DRAFT_2312 [Polychaeton citri CBS 116435]|uniref:Secreted protein n=1 Tax=Polychaeton citri CBS 116435 TaxID=1314669 RepID=A0A9P4UTI1_9PEZI|nr:hypothetical protein K431DRAFT_2312 [Polychaeton citri CBS 116435]